MARLRTIGFETNTLNLSSLEGTLTSGGGSTGVQNTFNVRSGRFSVRLDSISAGTASYITLPLPTISAGTTVYFRSYFYIPTNFTTSANPTIIQFHSSAQFIVTWNSNKTISLKNSPGGTSVTSSATYNDSAWHRIEVSQKIVAGAGDEATLKIDGVIIGSLTSQTVTDTQPTEIRCGFVTSPGGVNTLYLDDIAINDSTGSYENSWPGEGKIVLLRPVNDNTNTSWTAGAGATTTLFDAVNAIPPVGVASASQTNTSNIETAVKTTNAYRADMTNYAWTQYGHDGLFLSSGSYSFGVTAGNTESAYKFIPPENITVNGLTVALHKTGTPTDNVVVSIKSDSSGSPGTTLASGSIAGGSLTTSPAEYSISLNSNITMTAGTTYWVHFSRSGGTSLTNYFAASISNGDYVIPSYLSVFYTTTGLGWSAQPNYTCCLRWSFVNGTGNNTIKLTQALIDTAEDISTGTKTGTFSQISNPAQGSNDTIAAFGNDAGAAGTWPTNWFAYWGTPVYYPSITTGTRPVMEVTKTDTGTRTALVDFMGIYVEYVDVNDGPTVTFDNTTFPDQNYYLGPFVA